MRKTGRGLSKPELNVYGTSLLVLCSILLAAVYFLHQQLFAQLCLQVKNTSKMANAR
jgi:hypothetical protein